MRIFRKILAAILITALVLGGVFLAGRYGWKIRKFDACQGAGIESVEVREDAVRIRGFYPGSFPAGFCGYYAEEQDGRLYVGFRFSALFGFFETGQFDITIPVSGEIREVILKTKTMETGIWAAQEEEAEEPRDPGTPDMPADTQQALTLPILEEIDALVTLGTSGSSMLAVQAAVKLLDWGENTGLDTREIQDAAAAWAAEQEAESLRKLSLVDEMYGRLLGDDARDLLDMAGCETMLVFWDSQPVEPIEAVMQGAGLRG